MKIYYEPHEVSQQLATHENCKHIKRSCWAKKGIQNDVVAFKKYIENAMSDKETKVYRAYNQRNIYYSKSYQILIAVNLASSEDFGSAYFSKNSKNFDNDFDKDRELRKKLNFPSSKILKGGHVALFEKKKKIKLEKEFKANKKSIIKRYRDKKQFAKKSKDEKGQKIAERYLKVQLNKQKRAEVKKKHNEQKLQFQKSMLKQAKKRDNNAEKIKAEAHKRKEERMLQQQQKDKVDKLKIEAQKRKDERNTKTQQATNERIKEGLKKDVDQRKSEKEIQDEAERQRRIEQRKKALEEAALRQNTKDITKRYYK